MSTSRTLAQHCEPLEGLVPARLRLPLRYHAQRLAGALEPEMALLPELVRPGDVAVDIGANRGVYAYALSRIAAHVHCFEPLKECCEYIERHGSARITVRNVALSDAAGEFELFVPLDNGRRILTRASLDPIPGQHERRRIGVMRLDEFDLGPIAFIKIDVEGVESSVLRGAAHTLETHRPRLLVEIDRSRHDERSFRDLTGWLADRGYAPHILAGGELHACGDPWSAPPAVYNFIFLPR